MHIFCSIKSLPSKVKKASRSPCHLDHPIAEKVQLSRLGDSPPETPECWNLQFQTEAIFADNFPNFADNLKG